MFDVAVVELGGILALREEYRREMNCQIVHDSWHARGFTSSYLLQIDGEIVGYGSVGGAPRDARDIVKEFFVRHDARRYALPRHDSLLRLLQLSEIARASVFTHTVEPVGDWAIEHDGEIAATGGVFVHDNPPYGDVYMEVSAPHQRK